jgi:hypothetical protein
LKFKFVLKFDIIKRAPFKIDTSEMHMKVIFNSIGSLLRVLITLDGIIDQHPHLKDDWNAYKRYLNEYFEIFLVVNY